nr:hypothetical protein [Spirochaetales bacterium]
IIGHPRSGTTFIHHLFTQTDDMAAFTTWQLLFPALTARIIVKPIVRFLTRKQPMVLIPESAGHQISLDSVEEDEMLFLHNHDTQFVIIGTPLGFAEKDYREIRFHDLQPRKKRISSALFLKSIFQRHIYYTEKQKVNYYNRRYQDSLELYRYFYELWHNDEIDKERELIVDYKKLRNELMPMFEQIVEFTGIHPSDELRDAVNLAFTAVGMTRDHIATTFSGSIPENSSRSSLVDTRSRPSRYACFHGRQP